MSKRSCLFPDFVQFFVYNLKSIYQHFKKKRISRNKLFCSIWFTFKFPFFFRLGYILLYIFKFQEYFKFFFFVLKRCQLFPDPLQCFIYLPEYIYQHYEKKRISGKNYFAPYYSPQYFSFFFVWVIYFWYIVKFQEYFKFFFCVSKSFHLFPDLFHFFTCPPKSIHQHSEKKRISGKDSFCSIWLVFIY